ncbi:hypothetical protein WA158_003145 [Blastocystis sp. Blastoise]
MENKAVVQDSTQKKENIKKVMLILFYYCLHVFAGIFEGYHRILLGLATTEGGFEHNQITAYVSFLLCIGVCFVLKYYGLRWTVCVPFGCLLLAFIILMFPSNSFFYYIGCVLNWGGLTTLQNVVFVGACSLLNGKFSATLMCVFYFFNGLGEFISAPTTTFFINLFNIGYKGGYIYLIILMILLLIWNFLLDFNIEGVITTKSQTSPFISLLKTPMIWIMGCTLPFVLITDEGSVVDIQIFLKDFGNFNADGWKTFYYLFYCISLFIFGYVSDRIGHVIVIIASFIALIVLYILGMLLKENGYWPFAITGVFTSILTPIYLTLLIDIFKTDCGLSVSVIYFINMAIYTFTAIFHNWLENLDHTFGFYVLIGFYIIGILLICFNQYLLKKKETNVQEFEQLLKPIV